MKKVAHVTQVVLSLLTLSLLVSCQSGTRKSADSQAPEKPAARNSAGPHVDLNCVIDRLQNPPESFHYMFKEESTDNPWEEQADVSPQMIDGSFKSGQMTAPSPLHATPQEMPHQYQWAVGRMASLFALVGGSAVDEGAETVNGYSTTKLSIDSARGDAAQQVLYKNTLGPGGFDRGTVWVTSDGCPVKLAIDEEVHANDGSMSSKAHYEEAIVKK